MTKSYLEGDKVRRELFRKDLLHAMELSEKEREKFRSNILKDNDKFHSQLLCAINKVADDLERNKIEIKKNRKWAKAGVGLAITVGISLLFSIPIAKDLLFFVKAFVSMI